MCTSLNLINKNNDHLFGRNLDLAYNVGQSVGIIPRKYPYENKATNERLTTDYAIIGMLTLIDSYPALLDGVNEHGLAIAGLNFPEYTYYETENKEDMINIPGYHFMLWVLAHHKNLDEVRRNLLKVNLTNHTINPNTPAAELHWMITDLSGKSIVVEKTKDGLNVFENNVGVLTNPPSFDWHTTNLRLYMNIEAEQALEKTWSSMTLKPFGLGGAGSIGLPGDATPTSRFVKAAFLRHAMLKYNSEEIDINDFFYILKSVSMVKGFVRTSDNISDITQYTACMNQEKGLYYYNTYNNNNISVVDLHKENLNDTKVKLFKYNDSSSFQSQN